MRNTSIFLLAPNAKQILMESAVAIAAYDEVKSIPGSCTLPLAQWRLYRSYIFGESIVFVLNATLEFSIFFP